MEQAKESMLVQRRFVPQGCQSADPVTRPFGSITKLLMGNYDMDGLIFNLSIKRNNTN